MKERINWIDTARGIAMVMVIYSHLEYCQPYVLRYFRPIFLTTFFFVSGYLFNRDVSFFKMVEQRTRTLLIPFFIYSALIIVTAHIFTFHQAAHTSIMGDFKGLIFQIRGQNDGLWFIACLFTTSIVFHQFAKHLHNSFVLTGTMMVLFVLNKLISLPPLPWHIQFIAYGMFYMSLGVLYKENESHFKCFHKRYLIALAAFLFVLLVTIYWNQTNKTINFWATKYIVDGWIITVLGVLLCVAISKKICSIRILQFIGANSLLYFALHGKGNTILYVLAEKVLKQFGFTHSPFFDLILGFAITSVNVFVVAVPILLINRYASFTLGKGFKLINFTPSEDDRSPKKLGSKHY